MNGKFLRHTRREYSYRRRLFALVLESGFFAGILPLAIVLLSPLLDARLGLPSLVYGKVNLMIGWLLIAVGFSLTGWAIYVQFTVGKGTPSPVMATQKLIVEKPYSYCRNPMALGMIVFYLGAASMAGSISAMVLVVAAAVVFLAYVKAVEEKEMELRFGDSYREYRERTPFLFPRLWRGRRSRG